MSLLNQGFPQPLVAPVALAVAQASARPVTGALGAAAPDTYAANGFSPDYVADFSAASADYFRVAGSDSDFATAFTSDSEGGGLAVQNDSSGKVVWRAHNELAYSEQFDNAAWLKNNVSVTANADTAPDGTVTADLVTGLAGTAAKYIQQAVTAADFNRSAFACFKENTHRYIQIYGDADGNEFANFDLRDGSVGTEGSAVSGSTTALPNGYYLINIDVANATANNLRFALVDSLSAGYAAQTSSTGSVYVWGAGLYRSDLGGMADNPDPVATGLEKYVPTTTAARYLARRRHHRWDGSAWVPTCLHEPVGATNLLQYSNDFSQWTIGSTDSLTVTPSAGTGPDGNTSLSLLEITDTTNEVHGLFRSESISAGTRYVASGYLRNDDQRYVALRFYISNGNYAVVVFDLNDGSVTQETDVGTVTLHDSGVISEEGGLYRVWLSATESTATTAFVAIDFASTGTPSFNSAGVESYVGTAGVGLYAGFCDLVAGSLPSSHIPTNGSTVTRTADTLKGKAASLPYSSTAISMAVKGRYNSLFDGNERPLNWYQNTSAALSAYFNSSSSLGIFLQNNAVVPTGSTYSDATPPSGGINVPLAWAGRAVAESELQAAVNGSAGVADSTSAAFADLSDDDLFVSQRGDGSQKINGTVDTIRLWDEDIAEAGIEEATA